MARWDQEADAWLHWSAVPIALINLAANGYDTLLIDKGRFNGVGLVEPEDLARTEPISKLDLLDVPQKRWQALHHEFMASARAVIEGHRINPDFVIDGRGATKEEYLRLVNAARRGKRKTPPEIVPDGLRRCFPLGFRASFRASRNPSVLLPEILRLCSLDFSRGK